MNSADKQQVARALVSGGLIGGGVGLITSLVNHLKTMDRRAQAASATDGDDDVIYINVPKRPGVKAASDDDNQVSPVGTTLALAGLPVAAIGTNALVRKIYGKLRRKQLQAELDAAQQLYIDDLAQKSASDSGRGLVGGGGAVMAIPAAALLVALTSGVLSHKVLDKQFPAVQSPRKNRPRRMVIREVEPTATPDGGMIKEQSAQEDMADAYEHLIRTVISHPDSGAASGLLDLVKAAAAGRTEEILRASDDSMETVFEVVKGAADTTDFRKDLAIAWLAREPELMPSVVKLAAAEYREVAPVFCAMAACLDDEGQEAAVKAAADFCRVYRFDKYAQGRDLSHLEHVKAASALDVAGLLQSALESSDTEENGDEAKDQRDPELQLGGTTAVESQPTRPDISTRGEEAKRFLERNKDHIDDIFSPEKKEVEKAEQAQS